MKNGNRYPYEAVAVQEFKAFFKLQKKVAKLEVDLLQAGAVLEINGDEIHVKCRTKKALEECNRILEDAK
jgi:hypothetical protein